MGSHQFGPRCCTRCKFGIGDGLRTRKFRLTLSAYVSRERINSMHKDQNQTIFQTPTSAPSSKSLKMSTNFRLIRFSTIRSSRHRTRRHAHTRDADGRTSRRIEYVLSNGGSLTQPDRTVLNFRVTASVNVPVRTSTQHLNQSRWLPLIMHIHWLVITSQDQHMDAEKLIR
jgi:hypothetical protein